MVDNTNKSINHQSHPHQEGQENNIAPLQNDGQRNTENHSQAMSNIMQDEKPDNRSEKSESRTGSEQQGERQK